MNYYVTNLENPCENISFKNYYSSNKKSLSEGKRHQFELNRARADKLVF